jgi:hypothetical protein
LHKNRDAVIGPKLKKLQKIDFLTDFLDFKHTRLDLSRKTKKSRFSPNQRQNWSKCFPNWPNFTQIGAQKPGNGSKFSRIERIRPFLNVFWRKTK